jgi:hypothetical protein
MNMTLPPEERSVSGNWTPRKIAVALARASNDAPDQSAKRVVSQLIADPGASEALRAITKSDRDLVRVLRACYQSKEISRTFSSTMSRERVIIQLADKLKKGLTETALFLDREIGPHGPGRGLLAAEVNLSGEDKARLLNSLETIGDTLSARDRAAQETILRYGSTRNSALENENAGQTAAIGWLADSIARIAGKPHTRHVAVLAKVSLETKDIVTSERVREALKTRRGRDWRVD